MNTLPTQHRSNMQASPEARATAPARSPASAEPAWQQALDRAGERASKRANEGHSKGHGNGPNETAGKPPSRRAHAERPQPAQPTIQRTPSHRLEDEVGHWAELAQATPANQQPLHNLIGPTALATLAQAATAQAVSTAEVQADAAATRAGLAAHVAHLAAPVAVGGVQHWQFSFSHAGSPLTGLALTAQAGAPWQMHLQLPAQARERTALDVRLTDLRLRLAGRGAEVGDISLETALEAAPHDRIHRQEPR